MNVIIFQQLRQWDYVMTQPEHTHPGLPLVDSEEYFGKLVELRWFINWLIIKLIANYCDSGLTGLSIFFKEKKSLNSMIPGCLKWVSSSFFTHLWR